jgi:hypothetical protein
MKKIKIDKWIVRTGVAFKAKTILLRRCIRKVFVSKVIYITW